MSIKAGTISGIAATIVCSPLDNLRINLQTQNSTYLDTFKYIYKKKGILGFYNGVSWGIITIPTFWGIFFPTYEKLKSTNMLYSGVSAYIACNLASTITSPLWYIRQKYCTFKTFNIINEIKNYRVLQFYSGLTSTYLINTNFIVQLPLYEFLSKQKDNKSTFDNFCITAISKTIASTFTFPIENIRAISRDNHTLSYKDIIHKIINKKLYFKGYTNYLIRSIPYHGTIFCTYEYLRN